MIKARRVWKNKNFTKRSGDCTNVVACISFDAPENGDWEPGQYLDVVGLDRLYTQAGVEYYGHL